MQITGSFPVPAPRSRVWEALNDPETLRQCIPGCEELTKISDTELEGKVVARVGPVKASFTGKVTLSDLDPPNGYTISGEGKGGIAGFARGGAKVTLKDDGAGTILDYTAEANVGGKLAQVGARLIEAAADQMAQEFFGKFAQVVGAASQTEGGAAPGAGAMPTVSTPATAKASRSRAVPPWLWSAVAVIVAVAVILIMRR